jgi:hypothetical protein
MVENSLLLVNTSPNTHYTQLIYGVFARSPKGFNAGNFAEV